MEWQLVCDWERDLEEEWEMVGGDEMGSLIESIDYNHKDAAASEIQ